MEANPFPELDIANTEVLNHADTRVLCPECGRKRMYFCYNCLIYLNGLDTVMPKVKVPVKIDIVKHKQELDSKSTAPHAVLLSKEDCQILSFPDIPKYDPEKDVVIFPSDDSITVSQWADHMKSQDTSPGRVVFIDCTWNQIHPILNCEQLQGLPRIGLQDYTTKFWRPNGSKRDSRCLATIEAIYYFLREYHSNFSTDTYDGRFDNLLMIFKFFYDKIRNFHDGGYKLQAYKSDK